VVFAVSTVVLGRARTEQLKDRAGVFAGKRGKLVLRSQIAWVEAGGSYNIATGTLEGRARDRPVRSCHRRRADCPAPPTPEALQTHECLEEESATLAAHSNAATARWLELVRQFREKGGAAGDDFARWLAFRCGITTKEAREHLRVAEALEELPAIAAAFTRGELTLAKVRALTRVATPTSEEGLLELAVALTGFAASAGAARVPSAAK
jgi:hypothetical protein